MNGNVLFFSGEFIAAKSGRGQSIFVAPTSDTKPRFGRSSQLGMTRMFRSSVNRFAAWMVKNADRLRPLPAEVVAEEVHNQLQKVCDRLGVEIGDDADGDREAIITAFSDEELFGLVERIVHRLSAIQGWDFVALKPPRGFGLTVSMGSEDLEASQLRVLSIPDVPGGYQLLIPPRMRLPPPGGEDGQELAWLVVEAGVGERLSSTITHLEFGSSSQYGHGFPISQLAEQLKDRTS